MIKKIVFLLSAFMISFILLLGILIFFLSNKLYQVAFNPDGQQRGSHAQVLSLKEDRIELKVIEDTWGRFSTEALYALKGKNGAVYLDSFVAIQPHGDDVKIIRKIRKQEGQIAPKEIVFLDKYYYFHNPRYDHGIAYETLKLSNALGKFFAWKINGKKKTWVIYLHGLQGKKQIILKTLDALHKEGYPVLVFDYRNDPGAPRDPSGIHQLGLTEWQECEMAVRYAAHQGAKNIVLKGISLGGAMTMRFMENSPFASNVDGLIFDAPLIDFSQSVIVNAKVRYGENVKYLIEPVLWLTSKRLHIQWKDFDVTDLFLAIKVPTLILHTEGDQWVPHGTSEKIARENPRWIVLESFPIGNHLDSWNGNPSRYTKKVLDYLRQFD